MKPISQGLEKPDLNTNKQESRLRKVIEFYNSIRSFWKQSKHEMLQWKSLILFHAEKYAQGILQKIFENSESGRSGNGDWLFLIKCDSTEEND